MHDREMTSLSPSKVQVSRWTARGGTLILMGVTLGDSIIRSVDKRSPKFPCRINRLVPIDWNSSFVKINYHLFVITETLRHR